MTTFYIIRHGETDWNAQKRVQGQTDVPLNENGRFQAKDTSKTLKEITFDLAFSSDLLRAKETTEIIALEHDLTVETTKLLRERTFGNFEGKSFDAVSAYDKLFQALSHAEKSTFKYDEGSESDNDLAIRFITFLRETAITHPNKTILVGTHGGIMRGLLLHLEYLTYNPPHKLISNGAYVKLRSDGIDFFVDEAQGIKDSDIWN